MFKAVFYAEVVCQKIQHVPLVMSITSFPIKYCVACKKSTIKVLINLGFVTSFEDSHYILLFRYIYGALLIQWFCYSKHLHVNRNYRPNGTATSLSPKCYSANVPLDLCTTADFDMKYFLTKTLLAFWVIPNWFSRFCSQNGYLNSKLMLRWDSHFRDADQRVRWLRSEEDALLAGQLTKTKIEEQMLPKKEGPQKQYMQKLFPKE